MAVNMYDQAAEAPILNTYVPINFDELYRIGQTQQEAVEEAQNLLTNALTTFGEFRSPSTIDTENYYNLSIGRFQDIIDAAAADPNLMKDPAFRAGLQQRINSLDYASLSLLRESADNMRKGLEMRAKMMAEGTYNRNWDDANITGYDTLSNRAVFDDITPVTYLDANTLSNKYFDNLKQGYIGSNYENGIKYNYYGNTREDLMQIANARYNDLINTPQGQKYYEQLLRQNNGNTDKAREAFINMIADSQIDRTLRPNREVDPVWLATAKANSRSGSDNSDNPVLNRLDLINTGLNNRLDQLYKKNMTEDEKLNHARGVLNLQNQLLQAVRENQQNPTPELQNYIQELQESIITLNFGTLQDANRREALKAFKERANFDASAGSTKPEEDKLYNKENYIKGINAALQSISVPYSVSENDQLLIQQGGVPHKITENDGTVKNVYSYSTSTGFMLPENVFNGIVNANPRDVHRVGNSLFRKNDLVFNEMFEGGELSNIEFEPQPEVLRLGTGQNAVKGKVRIPVEELENKLGTGTMARWYTLFRQGRLDMSLKQNYNAKEVTRKVGDDDVEYMEFDAYKVLAPENGTAPESNTAANTMWVNSPTHGGIGSSTLANGIYGSASLQNLNLQ